MCRIGLSKNRCRGIKMQAEDADAAGTKGKNGDGIDKLVNASGSLAGLRRAGEDIVAVLDDILAIGLDACNIPFGDASTLLDFQDMERDKGAQMQPEKEGVIVLVLECFQRLHQLRINLIHCRCSFLFSRTTRTGRLSIGDERPVRAVGRGNNDTHAGESAETEVLQELLPRHEGFPEERRAGIPGCHLPCPPQALPPDM